MIFIFNFTFYVSLDSYGYFMLKGEMTLWLLHAQFSEDQDTVIKPQMPFVKCQHNSWMLYEVSDIKIFKYFFLIG